MVPSEDSLTRKPLSEQAVLHEDHSRMMLTAWTAGRADSRRASAWLAMPARRSGVDRGAYSWRNALIGLTRDARRAGR